jgi:hypothetical protein
MNARTRLPVGAALLLLGTVRGAPPRRSAQPVRPTWSDRLYSCRYVYPGGSMLLSVKDLPDATVLTVDVSALPAGFGKPARSRASAARTVATTVLICWKEG